MGWFVGWVFDDRDEPAITLPLVTQAGFDPIWFGIYLVIMIELAQITPPVGFNLFVIRG
jgi:TRAP-type C4-dicarboxylate transport system permease large subunit